MNDGLGQQRPQRWGLASILPLGETTEVSGYMKTLDATIKRLLETLGDMADRLLAPRKPTPVPVPVRIRDY